MHEFVNKIIEIFVKIFSYWSPYRIMYINVGKKIPFFRSEIIIINLHP